MPTPGRGSNSRRARHGSGNSRGRAAAQSADPRHGRTTYRTSPSPLFASSQLSDRAAGSSADSHSSLRRHPSTRQSAQYPHMLSDDIVEARLKHGTPVGGLAGLSGHSHRETESARGANIATDEEDSNFDATRGEEVIMAIDMRKRGTLGCAFFSTDTQGLHLLHDMDSADAGVLESLLAHIQPTTVLLPLTAPEVVVELLGRHADLWDEGHTPQSYVLRMVVSAEFNHNSALERLVNLNIHSIFDPRAIVLSHGADCTQFGWSSTPGLPDPPVVGASRLGSLIELESRSSIACAGAILAELSRKSDADRDLSRSMTCHTLQMFALTDFLLVNVDTLSALQIIQPELHPNSRARGTGEASTETMESLSIYGLFSALAGTSQGKTKLRQMILRPTVDLSLINERHRSIAVLLRPENAEMLKSIGRALRKVPDLRRTVVQLQKGIDSASCRGSTHGGAWWNLRRFAVSSLRLREALKQLNPTGELLVVESVIRAIIPTIIKELGEMIGETIDFREAKAGCRIAVRWGVNEELDRLRRDYNGMENLLGEVSSELSSELPEWARNIVTSCIFWPQLGFLTIVPLCSKTGNSMYDGQGLHGDEWRIMFSAEGKAYYKNRRMRELDAHLGDMYGGILDLEIEILHSLAVKTLAHEGILLAISSACGELDALVAMTLAAKKYGWTAPQMTTSNIISIRNGRHPLQELVVPLYIPNDCFLRGAGGHDCPSFEPGNSDSSIMPTSTAPRASMTVLTGPNHSGKSVYLKQVALITYLAHVGSYVPADEAIVGLTDQILTRISTRESVSRNESAFAVDLNQVALCMKSASCRSLLLIDEFGKGTTSEDGAGLMAALVNHYLSLGTHTPRMLAATHFHEIFEGHHVEALPSLTLAYMDVRLDPKAEQGNEPLTYLYKLVLGRSTASFGGCCAALNGVDGTVVDRANTIALLLSRNEDLSAACTRLDLEECHRLREAEAAARRFLHTVPGDWLMRDSVDDDEARRALKHVLENTPCHA